MSEQKRPVRVEEIDWHSLFPWLQIFKSFRIAIHLPKLLLALGLVTVLFLYGTGLDLIFGEQVYLGEVQQYKALNSEDYADWLAVQGDAERKGVFKSALVFKLDAFEHMVIAATSFNFGINQLLAGTPTDYTVVGALRDLVVILPGWLYRSHPGFLAAWMVGAALLWALVGGTIARMAALHACRNERIPTMQALRFARAKFWWFLLSPIIPLLLVLVIAALMALGGTLFNLPGTDIFAGLLFFFWLFGGLVVTIALIGLAGGANLLYPSIAVEGTEAFDALSRVYNYVFFRPWRLVFYHIVALVYGAITYLFVGLVIFLALLMTQRFTGAWVFTEVQHSGMNRFDAIMPPPQIGKLVYETDWRVLGPWGNISVVLVKVWVMLLVGMLGAYAISYYFASNTWVYLLLRQAADGAAFDDIYADKIASEMPPTAAPDNVEPANTPAGTANS